MAAEETSLDLGVVPADGGAESELDEDVVVRRKNKTVVLLSDDEVYDADKRCTDNRVDPNEQMLFSPTIEETNDEEKTWDPKRILSILDSDSEDEDISDTPSNLVKNNQQDVLFTVRSEVEDESKSEKNDSKSNGLGALVDTDSGEDDPTSRRLEASSSEDKPRLNGSKKAAKPAKKRTGSVRAAKEEAMREIQSETQRMLRESEVRLPYHRPRQRTLQEFMNRRKNLPTLPTTLTTATKVKISVELVGKVLEEKEKEAELFYKSSSESEDEESAIASDRLRQDSGENDSTKETREIAAVDPGSGQICEKIVKQLDKSLDSVSRKLFSSEMQNDTVLRPAPSEKDHTVEITNETSDRNQTNENFEQTLKRTDAPSDFPVSNGAYPIDIGLKLSDENSESSDGVGEIRKGNNRLSEKSNTLRNATAAEEGTEDFERKMSEDPYEATDSETATGNSQIRKIVDDESEAGLKTPFNDDRDLLELKENEGYNKSKSNGSSPMSKKSCLSGDDSENVKKPIGHVYGLPLPEFVIDSTQTARAATFPDIMNLTPKLQGSSDTVIELSHRPGGVDELMKRFLKHSVTKKTPESSTDVTVVRTERTEHGVKVVSEILPYKLSTNENNGDPELSKPGAKLTRLKEELRFRMAARRTEEWKQKELEAKNSDDEDAVLDDELSDCCGEDNDDTEDEEEEEEKEVDEDEEEEETSDREDDDDTLIQERKNAHKSPFVDAEAEEDDYAELADEEDMEEEEADCDEDSDEEDCKKSEDEAGEKNEPKKLRRIVKAFDDEDSKDSDIRINNEMTKVAKQPIRKTKTDDDMFATENNSDDDWLSGTEADLPVYQRRVDGSSQICATPATANNSLSIVSPITQLTALNTRSESMSADLSSEQVSSHLRASLSVEKTPVGEGNPQGSCDPEKREKLQKKLFDDLKDTPTDSELIGICSGRFDDAGLDTLVNLPKKSNVSDAELLELCSGTFDTQPIGIEEVKMRSKGADEIATHSLLPSLEESSTNQMREGKKISSTLKFVFSSDEEDDLRDLGVKKTKRKRTKKKVSKLKLSDDEEEDDDVEGLSDVEEKLTDDETFVDYDSEENEISVPRKDLKKAAARFLDEEAELSESEWGSADEDERDMDKLDAEEGDLEDIDQDQVRKQLEKIHVRQLLDADRREVRLLQEILLEDGELHSEGAGRERKFRWKNIDQLGEEGENRPQNGDEEAVDLADPNEMESEMEWRKQRLEREQFLQEHEKAREAAENNEEETRDSELFRLGMRALKKNKVSKICNKEASVTAEKLELSAARYTVADLFESPGSGKKTFTLQNAIHRGSFLARGEESLARLAAITRQNSDQAIIRPKNSRNFVFAHISPAVEVPDENNGQENANVADEHIKPRKRKPTFDATPVASKKTKREYERGNRSKLFN